MTDTEAEIAIKTQALVGTSNVVGKAGFYLFATGRLKRKARMKGQNKKQYLFRDRWGEIVVVGPASAFIFIR